MAFLAVLSLILTIIAASVYTLNSPFAPKNVWNYSSFHSIVESDVLSQESLLQMRLMFGIIIWASCTYVFLDPGGLKITVKDRHGDIKSLHIFGLERFSAFTVWCWSLQGLYFLLTAFATCCTIEQWSNWKVFTDDPIFAEVTTIIFEMSFSMAFLVTMLVNLVLIPMGKKMGQPIDVFFTSTGLLFHNANIVFMVAELLCNKIPFYPLHFIYVILFGIAYVVFSWYWFARTGIFYYFFLDYARPRAVLSHIGLLLGVGAFFFIGYALSRVSSAHNPYATTAIIVLTLLLLKFTP
jgi:hypothetical protein